MDKLDQHIEAEDQQPEAAWAKARAWAPLSAADIEAIGQFQWPGGYEVYFLDHDSSELCQPCALKDAQDDFPFDPIYYAGSGANTDGPVSCAECSRVIVEDPDEEPAAAGSDEPVPHHHPDEESAAAGSGEVRYTWPRASFSRPAYESPGFQEPRPVTQLPDCSPPDCEAYPR